MCIWKAWKKPKTKVANLIKCGIEKYKACEWGNTRKGYWRIADSPILKVAINNDSLRKSGYPSLMGSYYSILFLCQFLNPFNLVYLIL